MIQTLLVACSGNICRSPVAAAMLQAELPALTVQSAGLQALVGASTHPVSAELALNDGLCLADHRARQLTHQMIQQADLILVMDSVQRIRIGDWDQSALGKTMLLGQWLPDSQKIEDPYCHSQEFFYHVHRKLSAASHDWIDRLAPEAARIGAH